MLGAEIKNTAVYTDLNGLADLRREASQNSEQALEKTARQFEAMFVQMMLKTMREAGQGEGLFDSDQSNLYRDMYDKQLSLHLTSEGEGMGIAKMMVQQLKGIVPSQSPPEVSAPETGLQVPQRGLTHFQLTPEAVIPVKAIAPGEAAAVVETSVDRSAINFDSPEQFVDSLAPYAVSAAQRLGVDPRALLAQAALETGWGKAVIRHPDGSSSHNLFNIKADGRWDGDRVAKQTLEYRQDIATKEMAQFRSYDSLTHSFDDYANFLTTSPRYAEALKQVGDAERYVEALQEAGYATDPAYANKIKRILNSDVMARADSALKLSAEQTIT